MNLKKTAKAQNAQISEILKDSDLKSHQEKIWSTKYKEASAFQFTRFFPLLLLDTSAESALELFKKIPISNQRVLEIGCGVAMFTNLSSYYGASFSIGIDLSKEGLKRAQSVSRSLGLQCHFVCADAENLPFAQSSFDTVVSSYLLEHLANPQLTMANAYTVLRSDGHFLFSTMNKRYQGTADWFEKSLFPKRWSRKLTAIGHSEQRFFNPVEIADQLRCLGFDNVEIKLSGFFFQTIYDNYILRLSELGVSNLLSKVLVKSETHLEKKMVADKRTRKNSFTTKLLALGVLLNNMAMRAFKKLPLPDIILEKLGYSTSFHALAIKQ